MTKTTLLLTLLLFGLFACKQKDKEPEDIDKSAYLEDKNPVGVQWCYNLQLLQSNW
jgi:hypothetical protein